MKTTALNTATFNPTIELSTFKDEKDNKAKKVAMEWQKIMKKSETFSIRPVKLGSPAFSAAVYDPGATRANANVRKLSMAVFDFDQGDPVAVCEKLEQLGWEAIVASSYSYQPDAPHFHVVIPPDRPIATAEWKQVFAAVSAAFPGLIDPACSDVSRIYFWPCKASTDAPTFFQHVHGAPMCVDAVIAQAAKAKPAKKSSASKSERIGSREIAEYAYEKLYQTNIWHHLGLFRIYENGYWRPVSTAKEANLVKRLLREFPEAGIQTIMDAMHTLRYLAAHTPESISPPRLRICLRNGTLDPETATLSKHDPEDRLTWGLDASWDPEAKAPRFKEFLQEIWAGEPDFEDRQRFLQQWFGYLLYPTCKFERFLWLVGTGANGKSVLLKLMAGLVGEANVSRAMLERLGVSAVRAELEGKRLNISSEMSVNATLADGYFKAMVSGERVEADRKFRESVSFESTAKLVASTNTLPRLLDRSQGFARRATILSFDREFDEDHRDMDLAQRILDTELDGILAWAVEGLQILLHQRKFTLPPSSLMAVNLYRIESDATMLFFYEHLELSTKAETDVRDLYEAFKDFCADNGFALCNRPEFGRRLTPLKVGRRESNGRSFRKVVFKGQSRYAPATTPIRDESSYTPANLDDEFSEQ